MNNATGSGFSSVAASFHVELTPSGKVQIELLKKFVVGRSGQMSSEVPGFYPALLAICQSSGNGKTRLCYELLGELPGIMTVFRLPNELNAFPRRSRWADLFIEQITLPNDNRVMEIGSLLAYRCNVGRCLLAFLKLANNTSVVLARGKSLIRALLNEFVMLSLGMMCPEAC